MDGFFLRPATRDQRDFPVAPDVEAGNDAPPAEIHVGRPSG